MQDMGPCYFSRPCVATGLLQITTLIQMTSQHGECEYILAKFHGSQKISKDRAKTFAEQFVESILNGPCGYIMSCFAS